MTAAPTATTTATSNCDGNNSYIVAPVNLVVLNPIAFVLMQFSRTKEEGGSKSKFDCKAVCVVLKDVFTNPLVLLTFCGLVLR
jgi:hypothetical protein